MDKTETPRSGNQQPDLGHGTPGRRPIRFPGSRLLFRLIGHPEAWVELVDRDRRRARLTLRREARRLTASGLVVPRWYGRRYPALKGLRDRPAEDYLLRGVAERRDPSEHFDTRRYLALYPELDGGGSNPLLHFLDRAEQRDAETELEFRVSVESLPASVHTGLGTLLYVKGWCYATRGRIRFLDLMAGDTRHPVTDHSQPRTDVLASEMDRDPQGQSFFSGFETLLRLGPVAAPVDMELRLRLVTDTGDVLEKAIGALRVLPGDGATPLVVDWPGKGPRVAICMATHHPPLDLFAAQVASILGQTHENWVCIVSDDASPGFVIERMRALLTDPRFILCPNDKRLNFYENFERALRLCPADADAVALSDQDDRWYPEKLATLLDELRGETQLVCSDVRIVGRDGSVQSETYWTTRRHDYTSLPTLMAANTVIGAASLFRAALLRSVLPFPERLGDAFHDHWIGLNAMVAGGIHYIDRPLHDYVQHGDNVIGHKGDGEAPGLAEAVRSLLVAFRQRRSVRTELREMLLRATDDRQSIVTQKVMLAHMLLTRHPGMRPAMRRVVERLSGLTRIIPSLRERILAAVEKRPTLNLEGYFVRAVLISRTREAVYETWRGSQERKIRRKRYEHAVRHFMTENRRDAPLRFSPYGEGDVPAMQFGHIPWIFHNVEPLTLRVVAAEPRRINLLLATINFDILFGGYIGMFNLALKLRREGYAVRIVLVDPTDVQLTAWRRRIAHYPGLERLFDEVEVLYRYDRTLPLDVSPTDAFVATSGWTAHVAHHASIALGRTGFIFLIQDYEPFFGAMNTSTALLRQAYDFPQLGIFSTALLRDYFAENRIGVFETAGGEARSAVFSNAIQRFSPDRALIERPRRRILFYARPEDHAARNMFEMGIAALVSLFADPAVAAAGWTAHGIGSIGVKGRLRLGSSQVLEMVPKTSLQGYVAMLPGFDVGLSLMLTPHPSLVPLEMAAAGLCTVTNTFANKTADRLAEISSNLIGVKPTLEGIVEGLKAAISRVEDVDARLAGARMSWPTDWDAAFPADTMAKVNAFLNQ